MAIACNDLVQHLDELLQPDLFKDYCPNGLQVEGRPTISRIVAGVTACQALIDRAVALEADALLVHHGYFWRNEASTIAGMKKNRIATLLKHDINLIAYHLPLDAHPELGNNAQLAKRLGFAIAGGMEPDAPRPIGNWGRPQQPLTVAAMGEQLTRVLGRPPLIVPGGTHDITTVAWCTGAAQHMIDQAERLGVDAFISGEIAEATVHFAREHKIHYFSAGHHATERYGVQALAHWLEDKLGIVHEFVDIDSPA